MFRGREKGFDIYPCRWSKAKTKTKLRRVVHPTLSSMGMANPPFSGVGLASELREQNNNNNDALPSKRSAEAISLFRSYWIVRQPQRLLTPLTKSGESFEKWGSRVRCAIRTQTPNPKLKRPGFSLLHASQSLIALHPASWGHGQSTRPTIQVCLALSGPLPCL